MKNNGFEADVDLVNAKGQTIGTARFVYTIDKKGVINVDTRFVPDTAIIKSMPRVGLTFDMASSAARKVSYLGRGEHENYIDRPAGMIGIYNTTPAEMFHTYMVPEACGNHIDTRWGCIMRRPGCRLEGDRRQAVPVCRSALY